MTTKKPVSMTTAEPEADDPQAIRADIERTRAELGESVEALAAKADVKSRAVAAAREAGTKAQQLVATGARIAQDRLHQSQARHAIGESGAMVRRGVAPAALAAAVAAAIGAAVLVRRRRARSRRRAWWLR